MAYVLTVDQRGSRRDRDLVDEALSDLQRRDLPTALPFERTAGDEFQGMLTDAAATLDIALLLLRSENWSVGIGAGPVEEPLPASTRAARGPAFVRAREALDESKHRPHHVAVVGSDQRSRDVDAVLTLLVAVIGRRSDAGWEAVDLVDHGHTVAQTADRLGISRQAVGQRLAVALWQPDHDVRPVLVRLLDEAECETGGAT